MVCFCAFVCKSKDRALPMSGRLGLSQRPLLVLEGGGKETSKARRKGRGKEGQDGGRVAVGRRKLLPRQVTFSTGAHVYQVAGLKAGLPAPLPEGPRGHLPGAQPPLNGVPALPGVPTSRVSPSQEEHAGPPATPRPARLSPAQGRERSSFFAKQIPSPEQRPSLTPSCLAHRLIHLSGDKAPVNPHLIKAATKLAKNVPTALTQQTNKGPGTVRGDAASFSARTWETGEIRAETELSSWPCRLGGPCLGVDGKGLARCGKDPRCSPCPIRYCMHPNASLGPQLP